MGATGRTCPDRIGCDTGIIAVWGSAETAKNRTSSGAWYVIRCVCALAGSNKKSTEQAEQRQVRAATASCRQLESIDGTKKDATWTELLDKYGQTSLAARGVGGATVRKSSSTKEGCGQSSSTKERCGQDGSRRRLEHGLGDLCVDAPVAVDLCGNQPSPRHRAGAASMA